jgi:undecaprenyl-diphosphatase
MEGAVLAWLAAHRAPWLDGVMLALTEVGRGGTIWAVAAIAHAVARRRLAMAAGQVVIAVTLAWIIPDAVLKPLTARPRPFVATTALQTVGHERPSGYSFPSGHASAAVAGALALRAMWPAARFASGGLAVLVILSRAYLGVHYPSDLVAGALLGWLIAWIVVGRTRWRAVGVDDAPARD